MKYDLFYSPQSKDFKQRIQDACKNIPNEDNVNINIPFFSYLTNIKLLQFAPSNVKISICNTFLVKDKCVLFESEMDKNDFVDLLRILQNIKYTNNITLEEANSLVYICNKYSKYNIQVLINLETTQNLNLEILKKLQAANNNILIQIVNPQLNQVISNNDFAACCYNPYELHGILKNILYIEKGICPNWSSIQKALYIRRCLYRNVEFKIDGNNNRNNEATLRGFISRKNVCAGYSIMFQELLLRQGIECEVASGDAHAWNIVNIDGNLIPFDITWDSSNYYAGTAVLQSCVNVDNFIKDHTPDIWCKTKDYSKNLRGLTVPFVKNTTDIMFNRFSPVGHQYKIVDDDGTIKFMAQIGGSSTENGEIYYYYYVQQVSKDNTLIGPPYLFRSTKSYSQALRYERADQLRKDLSEVEINNYKSIAKKQKELFKDKLTAYLKTQSSSHNIKLHSVTYKRGDGSYIIIRDSGQRMLDDSEVVNQYFVYEYIRGVLVTTKVYTPIDEDLVNSYLTTKEVDKYFNTERLYEISQKYSGYIYGGLEDTPFSKKVISYFNPKRRIEPTAYSRAANQIDYVQPKSGDGVILKDGFFEDEQISMGR